VNTDNLPSDVIGVNMESVKQREEQALTPRTSYHHGDLRRTLLETALRLIAERGPEGFSLREAAREVSVSPAAAYRHFADKPALLAALAADGHGRLASEMEKAAARVPRDAPAQARAVQALVAIGQAYVEFAVRNPSFFRVMFGPAMRSEGFVPSCGDAGRDGYQVLGGTLDELVAAGAMPAARRPGAEVAVWSSVHGLATLLVDGGLPLTPRQRGAALRVVSRHVLLALGCDEALVPALPPGGAGFKPPEHAPPGGKASR
jgi:AcrR family transcriptional regulator